MADRIIKPDSGNDLVLQNDDASAKIEINEAGTIIHTGTSSIDVSGGTFTTSSAQKQAIVQAGPGSGTLDVSSGTLTTSSSQKTAIVDGGKGNLAASDVGLGNVTNESKATMFTSPTFTGTPNLGSNPTITLGSNSTFPSGHVIQTQSMTTTSGMNTTSSSYQNTNVFDSITPTSSSNKILVMVSDNGIYKTSGDLFFATIFRDSTDLGGTNNKMLYGYGNAENHTFAMCLIDSPSTDQPITYRYKIRCTGGTVYSGNGDVVMSMVLMEIKG